MSHEKNMHNRARSSSKSIKDKNIQTIDGHALLFWAAKKALQTNIFDEIYISSDSARYKEFLPVNSHLHFIKRPERLCQDTSFEKDYILHIVETCKISKSTLIARMQCTSPFQSIKSILNCIKLLEENSQADSVQLLTRSSPSIYKALSMDEDTHRFIPPLY